MRGEGPIANFQHSKKNTRWAWAIHQDKHVNAVVHFFRNAFKPTPGINERAFLEMKRVADEAKAQGDKKIHGYITLDEMKSMLFICNTIGTAVRFIYIFICTVNQSLFDHSYFDKTANSVFFDPTLHFLNVTAMHFSPAKFRCWQTWWQYHWLCWLRRRRCERWDGNSYFRWE